MLIAFAGLPGSGKTTIATALARQLKAVYLRIDTIDQALRSSGMLKGDPGPAGYIVAYAIAAENLRFGRIVVGDSVNPVQISRDSWREVADDAEVKLFEIEVICSDKAEHRRRVEHRRSETSGPAFIEGLKQPTWQEVVDREYAAWDRPPIVVDTAVGKVEDIVAELIARLGLMA